MLLVGSHYGAVPVQRSSDNNILGNKPFCSHAKSSMRILMPHASD